MTGRFPLGRWLGAGLLVAASAACSEDALPPPPDASAHTPEPPADPVDDPQRPPRGQAAIEAWLAAGHHRGWACEVLLSAPRLSGNHGPHRICSNRALSDNAAGFFPVGAASVKELFHPDGRPNGFAVGLKVEAGEGPQTWYWYERRGDRPTAPPLAQGVAVPDCAVCHGTAPRDYVFLRAP